MKSVSLLFLIILTSCSVVTGSLENNPYFIDLGTSKTDILGKYGTPIDKLNFSGWGVFRYEDISIYFSEDLGYYNDQKEFIEKTNNPSVIAISVDSEAKILETLGSNRINIVEKKFPSFHKKIINGEYGFDVPPIGNFLIYYFDDKFLTVIYRNNKVSHFAIHNYEYDIYN